MLLDGKFEASCNVNLNQWEGKKKKASSPNFISNLTSNVTVQSIHTKMLADGRIPNLNLI